MSQLESQSGFALGAYSENQTVVVQEQPRTATPDGGYGWIVTLCVAVVNAHSWGVNAAYSVFLAYYLKNDTFPGVGPLEYALVGSLSIGCTLLLSPPVTIFVRAVGTRPTMVCGALLQSVSLICASISTASWQLLLSQGAFFGIGMGLMFLPSYGIVSQWFTKRRALANGAAIAGAGLGGLTYSLSASALIGSLAILLIKTRYESIGSRQLAFDFTLLKRMEYIALLVFGSLSMLGYFVLVFTLANYANEIGLDDSQAAARHSGVHSLDTSATVLGVSIWINAKTYGLLIFFALVEGTVGGVFWVLAAPVMAEIIGIENLPSGLSIFWVVLAIPSIASAPIDLQIVAKSGSYVCAQIFTGVVFVVAGLCMGLLRGWQISQNAKQRSERTMYRTDAVTEEAQCGHPKRFVRACFWKQII
ncbi:hypothetical protein Z517_03719 [Fonsecaea pedrosoi CBS 271.37]|uniref:Major facilitator superfamily (MFS) profile domain-containing protein n=1 Tax=Fonsecaea pedrosoi CBS 271.37 TaxID=1442368 RepID=A0A0D2HJ64_9EURO|nr:uncharacterized protein Z517_03719 [Fonsecaea pedrosoi CBS 271.37]KIW84469.1 hypothetical protein Z517_03719 [Fonsecaea pedrosoi CBS 271.37]